MAFTVRDVMKIKSLENMKLLSGSEGLDEDVEWVYVAECFDDPVDNVEWLQGHEIIFMTGRGIKKDNEKLNEVIRAVKEAKASALVVYIGEYIKEIPQSSIELAESLKLPLFEIPWAVKLINISQEICKSIVLSNYKRTSLNNFMNDLLFGEEEITDETVAKAAYFGYDFSGEYKVCFIVPQDYDKTIAEQKLENESVKIKKRIIENIYNSLERHMIKSPVVEKENNLVIIYKEKKFNSEKLELLLNEIKKKTEQCLNGLSVNIGVSDIYDNVIDIRKSMKEAIYTTEVLKHENKISTIMTYDEIGIYRLLYNIKDKLAMEEYYYAVIGELEKYDELNEGELTKTLEVYLNSNCNVTTTADILYLHRNTLKYRMRKIEELLECDLHEFEDCAKLLVAFNIKNVLYGQRD